MPDLKVKTPRRRGGGVLIAAFAAVAAVFIAGGSARVYADQQQSGSLATAYASAAACAQAQTQHKPCTPAELVAQQRIAGNNDIRNIGNNAMAGAGVVTILAIL